MTTATFVLGNARRDFACKLPVVGSRFLFILEGRVTVYEVDRVEAGAVAHCREVPASGDWSQLWQLVLAGQPAGGHGP